MGTAARNHPVPDRVNRVPGCQKLQMTA